MHGAFITTAISTQTCNLSTNINIYFIADTQVTDLLILCH